MYLKKTPPVKSRLKNHIQLISENEEFKRKPK